MDDETSVGEMLRCVVVLARRYALVVVALVCVKRSTRDCV